MSAATLVSVIPTFRRTRITVGVGRGSLPCPIDPERICSPWESSMRLMTQIRDVAEEGEDDDLDCELYSEH
jgi:hypothetical protein